MKFNLLVSRLFIFSVVFVMFMLTACSENETVTSLPTNKSNVTELIKMDTFIGTGKRVINNHRIAVHYTGWLYDETADEKKGKKFDSSRDRGRPFVFSLGNRDVIAGWEQGILGMNIGGKRTLIIPPELGYGTKGAGSSIPPNAALIFDIEVLQAG